MRISLFAGALLTRPDQVVARAELARAAGLDGLWAPQTPAFDALGALTLVAGRVPEVRLGTAVVPIQGRHPQVMAQAARTIQQAAGGDRFTVGVGVTHAAVSERVYGVPYRGIVERCEEHLAVLGPLLAEPADGLAAPPGLVLAALGDRMLELAGRLTDGTVTWMTGIGDLRSRVVPRLREAAGRAGRPAPRVIVGLPVCVTEDAAGARAEVGRRMAAAAALPSYRRALAAEGVTAPEQIAVVGDADHVAERIVELADAGATELLANLIGPEGTGAATIEVLGRLVRAGAKQEEGLPGRVRSSTARRCASSTTWRSMGRGPARWPCGCGPAGCATAT
jgi:F420-dependent oxidoreductase-like protein